MSLFRRPQARKVGLKVFVTGNTGSGKSIFGLSFPQVYAIDSEAGLARYEGREYGNNIEFIANTQSFKELEGAMKEINKITKDKNHNVGTVVIDSETKFYQNLQETCMSIEENKALKKGTDLMDVGLSIRSWGKIRQISTKLQNMKIDLSTKGVNLISIAQVEDVKEKVGDTFVKVGEKPNANKNIEYDYDIVINLFTEMADGKVVYKGEIKKDRTGKTRVGQILENPSYAIWNNEVSDKDEVIETSFQDDVAQDIEIIEKEENIDATVETTISTPNAATSKQKETPVVDNKTKLQNEIKSKNNAQTKPKITAYLKEHGKFGELNEEQLQELLSIIS